MDVLARVPDSGEPPDHAVARTQMRSVLERKVDELPEIFHVVFVLRSVGELSVEEPADSLAIPPGTVRTDSRNVDQLDGRVLPEPVLFWQ